MKLTDFALIFIGIFLPIIIIVYVNTAFVVKAERQEMYYKNMMNSAVIDAVSSMKQIENEDQEIDYGYSGIIDNKVSINASVAVSTFYKSLANNFNISGNEMSLERLKMYIPVMAVFDYDGIYIHSAEQDESGRLSFVTKPKVYYTYSYVIGKVDKLVDGVLKTVYDIVPVDKDTNLQDLSRAGNLLDNYIYEVTFTMDDYIYLNIYELQQDKIAENIFSKNFYLKDYNNNYDLVHSDAGILSSDKTILRQRIVEQLDNTRKTLIAEIGMKEISYAVNKHNSYAKQVGINYNFRFSVESDATWYETMDGIGMIAVIQGISLGNRYLNYKAYSASDLIVAKRYFVSAGTKIEGKDLAYFSKDLYHGSDKCVVYKEYMNSTKTKLIPNFYKNRAEAATQGFYACPICKP